MKEYGSIFKVYKHTLPSSISGKENDMVYIGMTMQRVENRWRNGDGYYYNTHFYNAIQKYSWSNFLHEVLFDGLTREEAEQKEIELIAYYNSTNPKLGYNLQSGGVSHNGEYLGKPVICLETKTIYKSATEAGRILGINNGTISQCCKGDNKLAGIYHWMFADEYDDDKAQEWLENAKSKRYKEVYCVDTGRSYSSIKDASLDTGASSHMIGECCLKQTLFAGGLMWLYLNDATEENINYMLEQKKIWENNILSKRIICIETKEIYKNVKEAQDKTGINASHIRGCCKGDCKTAKGYHWMFLSDYTEESAAQILDRPKNIRAKRVICLNSGAVFDSVNNAAISNGTNGTSIHDCCKGIAKYAGKLPDGTKLHWMYYEDYLKQQQNNLQQIS